MRRGVSKSSVMSTSIFQAKGKFIQVLFIFKGHLDILSVLLFFTFSFLMVDEECWVLTTDARSTSASWDVEAE